MAQMPIFKHFYKIIKKYKQNDFWKIIFAFAITFVYRTFLHQKILDSRLSIFNKY